MTQAQPPESTLEEWSDVEQGAAPPLPGIWVLFSSVPDLQGVAVPLGSEPLVLGRGRSLAGREISDRRVSGHHLELRLAGPQNVELRDLGSRNGTFLEGVPVTSIRVGQGSIFRIGGTLLQFLSDIRRLSVAEPDDSVLKHFIGISPESRALRHRLRELVRLEGAVLITGEPGVGKEQAARALHAARACRGALVTLNCSVLTGELAASELFGHVRGAFTGANESREGVFRRAHQGTLFLDEVGDLPPAVQPKLLRALQEGRIRPVGSDRDAEVQAAVIAATNHDIAALVRSGQFRADLYSRLASSVVTIPPLRQRRADIVALVQHFLSGGGARLHPLATERLLLHPWPHNVRDLRAVIDLLDPQDGESIRLTALVEDKLRADLKTILPRDSDESAALRWTRSAEDRVRVLQDLLRRCQGNVAEVARIMGKRPTSVRRWLARYGIDPDRFRG